MTYEPLHHKYRPQTFAELVGQEAIAATLTNALRQQKIAPAYLFTGARGTGKTSSARILAKSLNCLASPVPTEQPCGVCEVCLAITKGNALDVIEIDAASNTGVDNIRELIERAQFAPVQCRYKVYAIDECHMLSNASFNALLKTLEEPPDRVVFVLATTDPQRVLPTIISRCQRFDFRRIELQAMVNHLTEIATQESIDIHPDALQLVAQVAQGGLRDAESLLDQLSLLAGQVTVERVWDLVGAVPERDLLALAIAIAHHDPIPVLEHTRHLLDCGREPIIVLQNLVSFYRDLMIAKTAPDRKDLVAVTDPTWEQMGHLAQALDLSTILATQEHLRTNEGQLKHSTQPRLWLEVILVGALSLEARSAPAPQSVNLRQSPPPEVRSAPSSTPVPSTPVEKPPVVSSPVAARSTPATATGQPAIPPQSGDLLQIWQGVLDRIPPITKGLLKGHGHLLAVTGNEARIGVPQTLMTKAQKQQERIEKGFAEVLNRPIKVKLEVYVPEEAQSPGNGAPTASMVGPIVSSDPTPPKLRQSPAPTPPPQIPTDTSPPPPSWEEDEVTRAAKNLAYLFNGQIVDLDGDISPMSKDSDRSTSNPLAAGADGTVEDDEDDVPF
ncbi:DNA polymerase III, subunit gamma and tau [Leptolyngbya sp. 'hensonii']|nr:DNA polymerase III subunit gamma/tau [Leptolyngbya sp. 'hensonii']OLP18175.1 DNA polymerase III, subunit gamma and tau [Leptolyngbya sp. 'hensonii']